MSMSRSLAMAKKSSWKEPVLTGASLALKIAKEATSDVPIVKQVVGVALNIVELAERAEKNRDAMRMLAEKAATLAQLVDNVVSNRTVDGRLRELLGHLSVVLAQVQEFMVKETAERNVLRTIYRNIFIVQKRTEELSNALEIEIHGFTIAALVDTRLYLSENARDDGQFRLLRDYEVQKLDVILQRETEYGTVTFARALVDGIFKPMVVRYISEDGPVASTSKQTILATVSSMETSHPNIAQFYGRGVRNGETKFTVLRSGVHVAAHYLKDACNDVRRLHEVFQIESFVLVASAYLQGVGIAWLPTSINSILVDDHGQPSIGALDDLVSSEKCSHSGHAIRVISTISELRRSFSYRTLAYRRETTHPRSIDEGKLRMWMESVISHSPVLRQVWKRVCAEELRIEVEEREELLTDICRMSPDIVPDATSHWNDLYARQFPLARRGQRAMQTRTENEDDQEGFTSDGEDESLEVNITCHLVCDTVSSSGHLISRGLKVWLNSLSDTAFIRRSYLIDFPEVVAADIHEICNTNDDPVTASASSFSCLLHKGMTKVPSLTL